MPHVCTVTDGLKVCEKLFQLGLSVARFCPPGQKTLCSSAALYANGCSGIEHGIGGLALSDPCRLGQCKCLIWSVVHIELKGDDWPLIQEITALLLICKAPFELVHESIRFGSLQGLRRANGLNE